MALSKIDVANMLTGATPVANGGTALTSGFVNGKDPRPLSKPLIINGDMQIAQRGTSTSGVTTSTYGACDRWETAIGTLGTWTLSQDTDNPTGNGFAQSFKLDCTTADSSPSAGDTIIFKQKFEGQDVQLFKKGTSSAEKLTVSFWIKATKTGTNILELFDRDNNRTVGQSYTVSSTNTWEKKVVNFPADTTGALNDDNALSFEVNWWLGAGTDFTSGTLQTTWGAQSNTHRAVGQVNHGDSTSNNVYITGVQLEVGEFSSTTLPPFQHEDFGENLERCQRYYFRNNAVDNIPFAAGVCNGTTNARAVLYFPQTMRAAPSLDKSGAGHFKVQIGSSVHDTTNTAFYYPNNDQALLYVDVSSGLTDGKGCLVIDDGGGSRYLEGSAEL